MDEYLCEQWGGADWGPATQVATSTPQALSRTLRALDNALRISSTGCSARSASQPANAADSAYGKLRLPPASLLIRSALELERDYEI